MRPFFDALLYQERFGRPFFDTLLYQGRFGRPFFLWLFILPQLLSIHSFFPFITLIITQCDGKYNIRSGYINQKKSDFFVNSARLNFHPESGIIIVTTCACARAVARIKLFCIQIF